MVISFIRDLPVRKVNGVGRVLERELDAIGVKTCGDIYEHRAYLSRLFGEKTTHFLLQTYLGLGRTDVQPAEDHERKSVGTESTFREMSDKTELRSKLRHIAEELEKDLKRVEVKGRTLCLKIKLHTYEVFTRQMSPPKAIHRVDDLYNYALPMLAKLEKEIPNMKLRLMGLRCTHLISTKKADVDSFFAKRANSTSGIQNNSADEWEVWPETEFEEAARAERQAEFEELERLSQEHDQSNNAEDFPFPGVDVLATDRKPMQDFSTADWHEPFGRYKYGSAPNTPEKPQLAKQDSKAESWECPICGTAQAANDREFNEHIDLCLSRGTIRNVVAENAAVHDSKENTPTRPNSAAGVKRKGPAGQSGNEGEAKQRKLFFA